MCIYFSLSSNGLKLFLSISFSTRYLAHFFFRCWLDFFQSESVLCSVPELALYITGMHSLRKDNLSPALQGDLRELGSECSHHAVPKQYNCHTEEHVLTHAFPYVFQSKGHRSLKWGHLMPSEGLSYVKNWNIHLSTWGGFSLQTPYAHNLGQLVYVLLLCQKRSKRKKHLLSLMSIRDLPLWPV